MPERDTKQLIAYAQQHHKIIIGPATVGGVQVGLQLQGSNAREVAYGALRWTPSGLPGTCCTAGRAAAPLWVCLPCCPAVQDAVRPAVHRASPVVDRRLPAAAHPLCPTQAGAFKIGDAAGTLDNIVACKLYRPGSVGFVSKSGGMSNEMYNVVARAADGIYEGAQGGPACSPRPLCRAACLLCCLPCRAPTAALLPPAGIAIGGDAFPGSTLSDHCLRYQNIPQARSPAAAPVCALAALPPGALLCCSARRLPWAPFPCCRPLLQAPAGH